MFQGTRSTLTLPVQQTPDLAELSPEYRFVEFFDAVILIVDTWLALP